MLKKFFYCLIGVVLLAAVGTAWYVYHSVKQGAVPQFVVTELARQVLPKDLSADNLPQKFLGFDRPKTYLVLFLNNTELRPGGGFIGAYAVVRFDKGQPQLLAVSGSESLDAAAPREALGIPPAPIAKYLKLDRWFFRDSNWSPDFASSSVRALAIYSQEQGEAAGAIDGVIGFTPIVVEELLKITGPITIENQTYRAEDFTARLEYEVEYGYAQRGVDFTERKAVLGKLGAALVAAVRQNIWSKFSLYLKLAERLLNEKQIVLFAPDSATEETIVARGWGGVMSTTTSDYLLWADANLGALKTDAAITRALTYRIAPSSTKFLATATMVYQHTGKFDWRTTRYLDYARVFVPLGSKLIGANASPVALAAPVDQGIENGRVWFGTFITVAPGTTETLSFEYELAPQIVTDLSAKSYALIVQKQIGTLAVPLTLGLDFGTTITAGSPPEAPEHYGDNRYDVQADLRTDKEFSVSLKP